MKSQFIIERVPLLVHKFSVIGILLDSVLLLGRGTQLEGLVEGQWVNFLQDCLQRDERLLQDLVPVILRQVNDDWHKHWEGLLLVRLQDVEEVIVFEETHGPVGDLQMDAANALNNSLEKLGN